MVRRKGRSSEFWLVLRMAFRTNPMQLLGMAGTGWQLIRTGRLRLHQDRIEIARFQFVDHGGGRIHGHGQVALTLDEEAKRFEDIRLVVGHQDAGHARFGRFHRLFSSPVTELQGHLRCQLLCDCSASG